MCVDLVSLAICTPLDVLLNFFVHSWPPIVTQDELNSAVNAWVTVDRRVMMCLNHQSFIVKSSSYYSSSIFIPRILYLLKPMWFDSRHQYIFILFIHWVFNGHLLGGDGAVGQETSMISD